MQHAWAEYRVFASQDSEEKGMAGSHYGLLAHADF